MLLAGTKPASFSPMNPPQTTNTPILIVDDDPGAVLLLQRLLQKAGIHNPVDVARDGAEAIAYLQRSSQSSGTRVPALMLLDLDMPEVDGFGVLEWIRAQGTFKHLLIAIVSSSAHSEDRRRAYELGARSYFSKFPVISDLQSVYHLATSILTVEELTQLIRQ